MRLLTARISSVERDRDAVRELLSAERRRAGEMEQVALAARRQSAIYKDSTNTTDIKINIESDAEEIYSRVNRAGNGYNKTELGNQRKERMPDRVLTTKGSNIMTSKQEEKSKYDFDIIYIYFIYIIIFLLFTSL